MKPEIKALLRSEWRKPELYLDADYPAAALHIADRLLRNYPAERLLMRKSASQRGYHFWVLGELHNCRRNIKLRRRMGDCRGRIFADLIRKRLGLPISVLFLVKGSKRAGEWRPLDMKVILEESFKIAEVG